MNYSQITLKIMYNSLLFIKITRLWALRVLSLLPHLFLTGIVSSPEIFVLTTGNPVAEPSPGFVTISRSRFVLPVSQADCCQKLWGSSSLTALSVRVTAECQTPLAHSRRGKTTAVTSQAHIYLQVGDKCISTPPTPLDLQPRFTQPSRQLQIFFKYS